MPTEKLKHPEAENVSEGITSVPTGATPDEVAKGLKALGYDPDETATRLESKVSAFLQQQRNSRQSGALPFVRSSCRGYQWRHPSVIKFAKGGDPIAKMIELAGQWALEGLEQGAGEVASDPFTLARLHSIPVIPRESITDARIVPTSAERLQVEFNPNQPRARVRFSLAHELAHSLFTDCGEQIRNRASRSEFHEHEWELEMLCNIGAAELLMPIATFPSLRDESLRIDSLMELRKRYMVSSEALLLRVASLTLEPCAAFAASVLNEEQEEKRYRVDYCVPSRAWMPPVKTGDVVPSTTLLQDCTAIGFTTHGNETWETVGNIHIEAVGITPYPRRALPRVVGLLSPLSKPQEEAIRIRYVRGDATVPRGTGPKIIAHVVNDKGRTWGIGFAKAVAKKWPDAQSRFTEWVTQHRGFFRLGNTFTTEIDSEFTIIQMISQHGYGSTSQPRIRYGALKSCLDAVSQEALIRKAGVHMPRIGTGQGGGIWTIIEQLIDETLCRNGIPVTVYDLPNTRPERAPELPGLFE